MNSEEIKLIYSIKRCFEDEIEVWEKVSRCDYAIDLLTEKLIHDRNFDFPTNIPSFIDFVKRNNMNVYISKKLPNQPLINDYMDINEEVVELLDEKSSEEKVQKIMKELLDLCRYKNKEETNLDWEEIYVKARGFISTHYVIEKIELDKYLSSNFPYEIRSFISRMYEKANFSLNESYVCSICGKPLDYTNEVGGCSNICNYYKLHERKADEIRSSKNRLVKLNKGIYKYILLPNIGEYRIYKKLKKVFNNFKVKLYPNIDEFDIGIYYGDVTINLDIKDHKNPYTLVKNLKENTNLYKFNESKYCFLVIPDHRVTIYKQTKSKNYMKELGTLLRNEDIYIKVIQERKLIRKIDQIVGEIDE